MSPKVKRTLPDDDDDLGWRFEYRSKHEHKRNEGTNDHITAWFYNSSGERIGEKFLMELVLVGTIHVPDFILGRPLARLQLFACSRMATMQIL